LDVSSTDTIRTVEGYADCIVLRHFQVHCVLQVLTDCSLQSWGMGSISCILLNMVFLLSTSCRRVQPEEQPVWPPSPSSMPVMDQVSIPPRWV
jgi:hypothetical protein